MNLSEPEVNTLIVTWTGLRLQRGPNASNLAAFATVADIPYVLGQTTYSYVDTSGASSDWYRIARYGPAGLIGAFSPAWPVVPTPTVIGGGARRSLLNARRMLGRRLGGLQVVLTTADGVANGTTLQSDGLANQLDANRYRGWWVMPTDGVAAGQVRSIGEAALNPTNGLLTVAPPFVTQVVAGTQVEFTKLLPPDEMGGLIGLRQALNLALAECWLIDRLALPGVGNQATYDITNLGDWLDPDAITEYYGPVLATGLPVLPWGGFAARRAGAIVDFDVPPGISTGAAMSIELTRPGDTLIKTGGVWTDQQQGLVNDNDEMLFQPYFIVEVALVHCWEALAQTTTGAVAARYEKRAEDQRRKANVMKFRGLPHPVERADHTAAAYGSRNWMEWIR